MATNEGMELRTDGFKQLHPHELYLKGVGVNIGEPKDVLTSKENHSQTLSDSLSLEQLQGLSMPASF